MNVSDPTAALAATLEEIRAETTNGTFATTATVRWVCDIDWNADPYTGADWAQAADQYLAHLDGWAGDDALTVWFAAALVSQQPESTIAAGYNRVDPDGVFPIIHTVSDVAWHTGIWSGTHTAVLEGSTALLANSGEALNDELADASATLCGELCRGVWDGHIRVVGSGINTHAARTGATHDIAAAADRYPDVAVDIAVRDPDAAVALLEHLRDRGRLMTGGAGRRLRDAVRGLDPRARSLAALYTRDHNTISSYVRTASDSELVDLIGVLPVSGGLPGGVPILANVYAQAARRGRNVTDHLHVPAIRRLLTQQTHMASRAERHALAALRPTDGPQAHLWDDWDGTVGQLADAAALINTDQDRAAA